MFRADIIQHKTLINVVPATWDNIQYIHIHIFIIGGVKWHQILQSGMYVEKGRAELKLLLKGILKIAYIIN